jgi:hypothetical protein
LPAPSQSLLPGVTGQGIAFIVFVALRYTAGTAAHTRS